MAIPTSEGFTLEMRFTGLFVYELFPDASEMLVSFIDENTVELHEPHANLMLLNLRDDTLKWPDEYEPNGALAAPDGLPLRAPQVLRIGSETYGMWGLDDRVVWVKSAHSKFYGKDVKPTFAFPSNQGPWKGLEQFLDMREVLSPPNANAATVASTSVPSLLADRVKSRVRVTQGTASGEVPFTRCEREREYGILKEELPPTVFRSYATEFTVSQFIPGDEVVLGVSGRGRTTIDGHDELEHGHAIVTLRGKAGSTVAMSFSNCPTTKFHRAQHFTAISRVLGVDEAPRSVEVREASKCAASLVSPYGVPAAIRTAMIKAMSPDELAALTAAEAKDGQGVDPGGQDDGLFLSTPPDPGCVPAFIVRPGSVS